MPPEHSVLKQRSLFRRRWKAKARPTLLKHSITKSLKPLSLAQRVATHSLKFYLPAYTVPMSHTGARAWPLFAPCCRAATSGHAQRYSATRRTVCPATRRSCCGFPANEAGAHQSQRKQARRCRRALSSDFNHSTPWRTNGRVYPRISGMILASVTSDESLRPCQRVTELESFQITARHATHDKPSVTTLCQPVRVFRQPGLHPCHAGGNLPSG